MPDRTIIQPPDDTPQVLRRSLSHLLDELSAAEDHHLELTEKLIERARAHCEQAKEARDRRLFLEAIIPAGGAS